MKDYFVMLFTQGGGYTPLMDDENIAKFSSVSDARDCAENNMLGSHFGFEIFRIGSGE